MLVHWNSNVAGFSRHWAFTSRSFVSKAQQLSNSYIATPVFVVAHGGASYIIRWNSNIAGFSRHYALQTGSFVSRTQRLTMPYIAASTGVAPAVAQRDCNWGSWCKRWVT